MIHPLFGRLGDRALLGRVRLVTGLVLFSYVLTHNLNHALGIHSLAALEAGRQVFLAFWRFAPLEAALYASAFLHIAVALIALYRRHSLRMPFWEGAQLILGLATPPMLMLHVLATAYASEVYDFTDSYTFVLLSFWVFLPHYGLLQALAVIVTWIHGCIGMAYWLRLKSWYPRARAYLFAGAVILPVLALIGFVDGAREAAARLADPAWLPSIAAEQNWPGGDVAAEVHALQQRGIVLFGLLLAAVLAARAIRQQVDRRRAILVNYDNGKAVRIQAGTSLLEASRMSGIPHASVCGGRGRCSTCRVRIIAGAEHLPPPGEDEKRVLARVGAAPDTRLACQLRPIAPVTIAPLLPAQADARMARARPDFHAGREMEIAILFADLRDFTRLSERRLPYDVVFLLNRYFKAMGEAVAESGGYLDKFIGDGVMALFGIKEGVGAMGAETACRQALDAARRMSLKLAELNQHLAADLKSPLRIGIGIHFGPAIVGDMGFGANQHLTAIGDTVNTASRLEAATKELQVQLVISEQVWRGAGMALAMPQQAGQHQGPELHHLQIRGREAALPVLAIRDAQALGQELGAALGREP
ncbi:adenylate cyclase [Dongia mobilis]|uniref:Adenylate cyclase n=1 Tax=Dongia mobilis TaxID=578943 RepID=A0A4R6WSZ8_9PROT|nr:adenylate/guanylate cyclase domain-containing protein [Dongia mobilis]TDQ86339.1 adenylate cyclase [Dongia mobilis]